LVRATMAATLPAAYQIDKANPEWMNPGHNAWQLTSATLVGLQCVGMIIFYGSFVKKKWAVNSAFMAFYGFAAVLVCWVTWAYKMSFGDKLFSFWGKADFALGVDYLLQQGPFATPFPVATMVYFQFVFAAITPILLAGSLLGRMNFHAWMLFVPLWLTFSYTVGAFSVWGGGFLFKADIIDFAGGYVIHLSSGVAGFTAAYWSTRTNNKKKNSIHSPHAARAGRRKASRRNHEEKRLAIKGFDGLSTHATRKKTPLNHSTRSPSKENLTQSEKDNAGSQQETKKICKSELINEAQPPARRSPTRLVGPRLAKDRENFPPNNILLTLAGAGLLWLGWTGFNGGAPYHASIVSSIAILNTHVCAATSLLVWLGLDMLFFGKPSINGAIQGMITGLVCITPGAGLVPGWAAIIMGMFSGSLPWYTMMILQKRFSLLKIIDDTMGVFHTHAVAGTLGGILSGVFAHPRLLTLFFGEGTEVTGLIYSVSKGKLNQGLKQMGVQVGGALFIIVLNVVVTSIICLVIGAVVPLRMSEEALAIGDNAAHVEEAYALFGDGEKYES
ncbi:hypothetical protein KI387_033806, partial [Taxus chinensis]